MRIALILEYDGTHYCGWQSQSEHCAVQDVVESALSAIAAEPIRVFTAGRTDAGVHALNQVVHFDTTAERTSSAWTRGVNALLPNDIAVKWSAEISEKFHARYDAVERRYLYLLHNRSVRPGLNHHRVGWFHYPLSLEKMQIAGSYLLGKHDFSAFRAAECQAKSPCRTVTRLDIVQYGDLLVFDLCANAFLQHMVRNIIGCLVYVGKGKYPPEWVGELLQRRNRIHAAPTFSAAGLYLAGVRYDACWHIPEFSEMSIIPGNILAF